MVAECAPERTYHMQQAPMVVILVEYCKWAMLASKSSVTSLAAFFGTI